MARVITLVQSARAQDAAPWRRDLLRASIVCGCALALILAKAPFPF